MLRFALARLEGEAVAAILTARDDVPPWLRSAMPDERPRAHRGRPLSVGGAGRAAATRGGACFPDRHSCASGRRRRAIRSSRSSCAGAAADADGAPGRRAAAPLEPGRDRASASSFSGRTGWRWPASSPRLPTRRHPLVEAAAGDWSRERIGRSDRRPNPRGRRGAARFTHPLLRSAVWSRATPAQGARSTRGSPGSRRARRNGARHPRSPVEPSREVAAAVEEAARSAQARGAPATAAELSELAVASRPPRTSRMYADAFSTRRSALRGGRRRSRDRPARAGAGSRSCRGRRAPQYSRA